MAQNKFDDAIIRSVLANNKFGIEELEDIEDLGTTIYDGEKYQKVVELISQRNLTAIREMCETTPLIAESFREYLIIIKFSDQNKKMYCATVYDSDELWQDPEIIDIFPF